MNLLCKSLIAFIASGHFAVCAQEPTDSSDVIADAPQSKDLVLRLAPAEENGSLIGFHILNAEELKPHLTGELEAGDVVLLKDGPLTGTDIANEIQSGEVEFLSQLLTPSSSHTIRWRVRSENAIERDITISTMSLASVNVAFDISQLLADWVGRHGAVESPELSQRVMELFDNPEKPAEE